MLLPDNEPVPTFLRETQIRTDLGCCRAGAGETPAVSVEKT
jgi:hypothetical protein